MTTISGQQERGEMEEVAGFLRRLILVSSSVKVDPHDAGPQVRRTKCTSVGKEASGDYARNIAVRTTRTRRASTGVRTQDSIHLALASFDTEARAIAIVLQYAVKTDKLTGPPAPQRATQINFPQAGIAMDR